MAYLELPLGDGPSSAQMAGGNIAYLSNSLSSVRERRARPLAPDVAERHGLQIAPNAYRELDIVMDEPGASLWCYMRPDGPPSVTASMLREFIALRRTIADHKRGLSSHEGLRYFVLSSRLPGIFNLGGDLGVFVDAIRRGDRERLMAYAIDCCDVTYHFAVGFDTPVVTIALVQGDALGGGFEGALACQILVAEKKARMGLPEVLFNLFPGMGAHSLLARKIGMAAAERMMLSGKVYTAAELYELGIVDVLAEDGEGEAEVRKLMNGGAARFRLHNALARAGRCVAPLTLEELRKITEIWVDIAIQLGESDLRKMERLALAQRRRLNRS